MHHYNLAIVGNDPAARTLTKLARTHFDHVFWSEELIQRQSGGSAVTYRFLSERSLLVETRRDCLTVSADAVVIAAGVVSRRPTWMVDHPRLFCGDVHEAGTSNFARVAIVGCGRAGLKIARQLQRFQLELICLDARRLPREQIASFAEMSTQVEVRDGAAVIGTQPADDGVTLILEDTSTLAVDAAYVCCGTSGNTANCNLSAAGLRADDAGKLWCNDDLQTWTPGIYALGDVVGYPCEPMTVDEQSERILNSLAEQPEPTVFADA